MYEINEQEIIEEVEEQEGEPEVHKQDAYFKTPQERLTEKKINAFLIATGMISVAIVSFAIALVYSRNTAGRDLTARYAESPDQKSHLASLGQNPIADRAAFQEQVIPSSGVTLPVRWGDAGVRMIRSGVIDAKQFKALYADRGGMTSEMTRLLEGTDNGNLKITPQNSGYILNLLWAMGLGQKSDALDNGPMRDERNGGAGRFASTGGWTIAQGSAMDHYSKHSFVVLTREQENLVKQVAQNIYRPCCGNSVYFPDCNHGMAMLGLLELMASQGVSEADMYKAALAVNSYWFPDTYDTIAQYMKLQGTDWNKVDPKVILGEPYSSGGGFRNIQAALTRAQSQNQAPQPQTGSDAAAPRRSSGGCGV